MKFHVICVRCKLRLSNSPLDYCTASKEVRIGRQGGYPWVLVAVTRPREVPHEAGVVKKLVAGVVKVFAKQEPECVVKFEELRQFVERN
jgi:hypothetical protein